MAGGGVLPGCLWGGVEACFGVFVGRVCAFCVVALSRACCAGYQMLEALMAGLTRAVALVARLARASVRVMLDFHWLHARCMSRQFAQ